MKNIIFTLFFAILATFATAQGGIIEETRTVQESGGIFYEFSTIIKDNGTPFPDTLLPKQTIGDSAALMAWAAGQVEARYNEVGIGMQEAFKERQARQLFTQINTIVNTATGGGTSLQDLLNDLFAAHYGAKVASDTLHGQYRINANGAPTFGRMVRLANGNYRLRLITEINGPDVSPQVQYIVTPRSKGNFRITYPVGGTEYSLWLNQLESGPDRLEYKTTNNLVPAITPVLRSIIKVR